MGPVPFQLYRTIISGLPVYLIDGNPIAQLETVYSFDNRLEAEKYVFFSLAALKCIDLIQWRVDVLHAHDWHTALSLYAYKSGLISSKYLPDPATFFTLHNLPFMGNGAEPSIRRYGFPAVKARLLPEWGTWSPLPAGLLSAEKIVPVSEGYAKEIQTPDFGCGLDLFLKSRKKVITGIPNGIDTDAWNPVTDKFIETNYDLATLNLKKKNKTDIQKSHSLEVNGLIPLLIMVSRIDRQKGVDLILDALENLDKPFQAILLGTGDPELEKKSLLLAKSKPGNVRVVQQFNNSLSHRLYAAGDVLLMPSRYEPCGISQMIAYAVRYSTGGTCNRGFKRYNHICRGR